MKSSTKKLISIGATMFPFTAIPLSGRPSKAVQRASDTRYVVLMITDIHFYDGRLLYRRRAFKTIDDLVKLSSPDLIIVTGDVADGRENNDVIFKAFGKKMESYKIPWTFSFGNHDVCGNVWSKTDIADYLEGLTYCKFSKGPADVYGYGNNYFNVTDENGKIIHTIFTVDTSGTGEPNDSGAHAVSRTQLDWYIRTVKEIAAEANGDPTKVVPSIMFSHIPMTEYKETYDQALKKGEVLYGRRCEKECPADGEEDLLLKTIVEVGSTKAYYCGHEHRNNYSVCKDGIRLSYGECCKQKKYIPTRGGLVINVKKDGSVTQQNIACSQLTRNYKISKEY